ncbi:Sulfhydryl oxidase 1 [Mortierella alpina]|nr:Sulfhydryl oxidase 1 [Mortierella alpina]
MDRSSILASMSKESNEALLVDSTTQDVYEGLSSNFFVLHRKRQSIITAPQGSVLEGTIMRSVISVCKEKSIPVEYSFPNLKNIDEWEGAFLSSMSRLVLPIEKLILPGGHIKQFESSPRIESIRDRVQEECHNRVETLLSESEI